MFTRLFLLSKTHWIAISLALCTGALILLPQIIFIRNEGSHYQGLYMLMQGKDEAYYLASMHEFYDEGRIGNPYLYEYKFYGPQFWPTGSETVLSVPGVIFHISVPTLNLIYKFLLPAIEFLLVYILCFRLSQSRSWSVAGALMVIMGLLFFQWGPLVDLLRGSPNAQIDFITVSRPINPQFSQVLLFIYVNVLLLIHGGKSMRWLFALGGLLAFSFYTYFYSFTFFLALNAVFFVIWLFSKRVALARNLAFAILGGVVVGIPPLSRIYAAIHFSGSSSLFQANRVIWQHRPLNSRPWLFVSAFLALYLYFTEFCKTAGTFRNKLATFLTKLFRTPGVLHDQILFIGGLLLTAFVVLNQQVITGVMLQYAHYIRYFNLPLFAVATMVLGALASRRLLSRYPKWSPLVRALPWIASLVFVALGAYTQYTAYHYYAPATHDNQRYMPALDWLKVNTPKESVVMADEPLSELIPVYTSDNVMWDSEHSFCCHFVPPERTAFTPEAVLAAPDFFKAIKAYRVDYILWDKKNEPNWNITRLHLKPLFDSDGLLIYALPK